ASRRLIEQQDARPGEQPLAEDDLLLRSSRELGGARRGGRRLDRQGFDLLPRGTRSSRIVQESAPAKSVKGRKRHVLQDGRLGDEARALPVLRDERETGSDRFGRVTKGSLFRPAADPESA